MVLKRGGKRTDSFSNVPFAKRQIRMSEAENRGLEVIIWWREKVKIKWQCMLVRRRDVTLVVNDGGRRPAVTVTVVVAI